MERVEMAQLVIECGVLKVKLCTLLQKKNDWNRAKQKKLYYLTFHQEELNQRAKCL